MSKRVCTADEQQKIKTPEQLPSSAVLVLQDNSWEFSAGPSFSTWGGSLGQANSRANESHLLVHQLHSFLFCTCPVLPKCADIIDHSDLYRNRTTSLRSDIRSRMSTCAAAHNLLQWGYPHLGGHNALLCGLKKRADRQERDEGAVGVEHASGDLQRP